MECNVTNNMTFEEAKEKLPLDFAKEEWELDGHWLNTLNFEALSITFEKDGLLHSLHYYRGDFSVTMPFSNIFENMKWEEPSSN